MKIPVLGRVDPKSFVAGAVAGAAVASFVQPVADFFVKIKAKVMPAASKKAGA